MQLMRKICVAAFVVAAALARGDGARSESPASFGGIYPHLGYFNDENECGTGAVVPWADRLWVVTYGPHLPNGSSDKLYEIDSDLNRTIRPESVGGTNANRMIHAESKQLFIGNHAIDAERNVRTIPHKEMFGRETAVARHLTDPENKVYFLTMEEGLYEVDVKTLQVRELCKDGNLPREKGEDVLPGYHGKGGYTSQGRVVYANNGESSDKARVDPTIPSGCLAEWFGEEKGWNVVRRAQFTEVTGPNGIDGIDPNNDVLWSLGWDPKSVLLAILDKGEWRYFRLPKASHCYDGAHGWNTEWPRIRKIDDENVALATMHGQFWKFPLDFRADDAKGIRPRSTYLKVIGDFAYWNGRVVFGCDDSAKSEFLNKSPFKPEISGPGRSNSNLWFVEPEKLDRLGSALGRGDVWLHEDVEPNVPSDPYLFAGYDRRYVSFACDSADADGSLVFELDQNGSGEWKEFKSFPLKSGEKTALTFTCDANEANAEWIRARADVGVKNATCALLYRNDDKRQDAPDPICGGLARPENADEFLGACLWVRPNNDRLAVVSSVVKDGAVQEERYYELTENGKLERVPCNFEGGEPGTIGRVKGFVEPRVVDENVCKVDKFGATLTYRDKKWILPVASQDVVDMKSPLTCRLDREVMTERDVMHCAGTFYELPAENAGGLPKIRPIATDGGLIVDYASYRGMLVISGVNVDSKNDSDRIVRSEDGKCALWLGAVDDLWAFGKPRGQASVWHDDVNANEPSDPVLATGFDKKTLTVANGSDVDVELTVQADVTGSGDWIEPIGTKTVPANGSLELDLTDVQAYWFRTVANKNAKLTATFNYR